ncbi:hypothetical protein SLA2020_021160 [Shorea laevis]
MRDAHLTSDLEASGVRPSMAYWAVRSAEHLAGNLRQRRRERGSWSHIHLNLNPALPFPIIVVVDSLRCVGFI